MTRLVPLRIPACRYLRLLVHEPFVHPTSNPHHQVRAPANPPNPWGPNLAPSPLKSYDWAPATIPLPPAPNLKLSIFSINLFGRHVLPDHLARRYHLHHKQPYRAAAGVQGAVLRELGVETSVIESILGSAFVGEEEEEDDETAGDLSAERKSAESLSRQELQYVLSEVRLAAMGRHRAACWCLGP